MIKTNDYLNMNKNLSFDELLQKYEESLWVISEQQMELRELYQEIDIYCQDFEELQDELSKYRQL